MKITAHILAVIIREVDERRHPAEQLGWFDADNLEAVKIDGTINLEEVADEINLFLDEKSASTRK